ncbi:hypothetical protein Hdeb2414_s0010g00345761 [Helianthus debilis subsp. tardiflorus]
MVTQLRVNSGSPPSKGDSFSRGQRDGGRGGYNSVGGGGGRSYDSTNKVGVHIDGHGISTDLVIKKNISVSRKLAGIWEPEPRSNLVSKLSVAYEADLRFFLDS